MRLACLWLGALCGGAQWLTPPVLRNDPAGRGAWFLYTPAVLLLAAMAFLGSVAGRRLKQGRTFDASIARSTAMLAGWLFATVWAAASGVAWGCNPDQEDPAGAAYLLALLVAFVGMGFRLAVNVAFRDLYVRKGSLEGVGPPKAVTLRDYVVVLVVGMCVVAIVAVSTRCCLGDMYTG